jgi:hypothetical protein
MAILKHVTQLSCNFSIQFASQNFVSQVYITACAKSEVMPVDHGK